MRLLTTIGCAALFAVAPFINLGCCETRQDDVAVAVVAAPQPDYTPQQPEPQPVVEIAEVQTEQVERVGVKVSMLPLSGPPSAPPPPPRTAFTSDPYFAVSAPLATAPASGGVCQIVEPGSVIYSDPPTVTLSESGQVVHSTGATYQVAPPAGTAAAARTFGTVAAVPTEQVQTYTTTTTTYSDPAQTTHTIPAYTTTATAVSSVDPVTYAAETYNMPATYTQPAPAIIPAPATTTTATTTTVYESGALPVTTTAPLASTAPAVYYPDSASPSLTAASFAMPLAGEMQLVPAYDIPPGNHPNDALPSQWFEIVRPGNGPIRIGRVSATCVCVRVSVPNRHIAAGERALVEARIIKRPPANNLTYGIFVNVMEPTALTLDSDITIRF